MGADPKPHDFIIMLNAEGTIAEAHPHGDDRLRPVHALESQARMVRMLLEEPVGLASPLLDLRRKPLEALSEALGRA